MSLSLESAYEPSSVERENLLRNDVEKMGAMCFL